VAVIVDRYAPSPTRIVARPSSRPTKSCRIAFATASTTIDIALVHWLQRAKAGMVRERARSRPLAENRETLFRELQHCISNDLQLVAALSSA
jgi:two-component system, sensor histidine kinase PdtaS